MRSHPVSRSREGLLILVFLAGNGLACRDPIPSRDPAPQPAKRLVLPVAEGPTTDPAVCCSANPTRCDRKEFRAKGFACPTGEARLQHEAAPGGSAPVLLHPTP